VPRNHLSRYRRAGGGRGFITRLLGGFAPHQRLGLCQAIGQQLGVLLVQQGLEGRRQPLRVAIRGATHQQKLHGDDVGALVQHLEEGMLPVGARLAPHHIAGGIRQGLAAHVHRLAVAFHHQLLQVGRQAAQAMVIRRHTAAGVAHAVAVPHVQQAQQHGQVALQRGTGEVLVHRMGPGQHGAELVGPQRQRNRQPDGRPHREPSAHPIPETKGGGDAKRTRTRHIGGGGHEMVGDVGAALLHKPLPGRVGVGHGFLGGEGFGRDDEQRVLRPDLAQHGGQILPIHIRDEMKVQAWVHEGIQRRHHHLRAQVRATNADVDHVTDVAGSRAASMGPHALDVGQHDLQHLMHQPTVGPLPLRRAQRGVQHLPAFGAVDALAAQHGVALRLQATFTGQVQQVAARGHIPVGARQIGKQLGRVDPQALHTLGVVGEELTQVHGGAMGLGVTHQGLPGHGLIAAARAPSRQRGIGGNRLWHDPGLSVGRRSGRPAWPHPRRTHECPRPASRWPWHRR